MTNDDDPAKIFADMAEKLRREAYAAGWRDCAAAVNKAIAEAAEEGGVAESSESTMEISASVGAKMAGSTMPAPGTTIFMALQAVRRNPGKSTVEIIDIIHNDRHPASAASIRTSLSRLRNRKLVVLRHRKWYLP